MTTVAPFRAHPMAALLVWASLTPAAHAQDAGDARRPVVVTGAVNVNSKGISTVPALTLGRPAAIVDLAVRKGDFAFEPQFRFALDGKPWSFLLWGRYRAFEGERFRLTVGGHPAYSFRARTTEIEGRSRDVIDVRRYYAAEVTPTYALTRRTSVGGYYRRRRSCTTCSPTGRAACTSALPRRSAGAARGGRSRPS